MTATRKTDTMFVHRTGEKTVHTLTKREYSRYPGLISKRFPLAEVAAVYHDWKDACDRRIVVTLLTGAVHTWEIKAAGDMLNCDWVGE